MDGDDKISGVANAVGNVIELDTVDYPGGMVAECVGGMEAECTGGVVAASVCSCWLLALPL
ncbi:unnamed protein product, partial [Ilex paraguariensis]